MTFPIREHAAKSYSCNCHLKTYTSNICPSQLDYSCGMVGGNRLNRVRFSSLVAQKDHWPCLTFCCWYLHLLLSMETLGCLLWALRAASILVYSNTSSNFAWFYVQANKQQHLLHRDEYGNFSSVHSGSTVWRIGPFTPSNLSARRRWSCIVILCANIIWLSIIPCFRAKRSGSWWR